MSTTKIRYIGPFGQRTGYAVAGQDLLMALHKHYGDQIELDIQSISDTDTVNSKTLDSRYHSLVPFCDRTDDLNWPDITIVHTIPKYCSSFVTGDMETASKKIAYTTWETDRIDSEIKEDLAINFDLLLTPSKHNQQILGGNVLPHCFDPDVWAKIRLEKRGSNTSTKKFLWVGVWSDRKNPLGILKTYFSTFTRDDWVELTLVCYSFNEKARQEVESLIDSMNLDKKDLPCYQIIDRYLSFEDLIDFHLDADYYISLHRGEGFGLGAFESALLDNCIIATDYGGMRDFHIDYGIRWHMTPALIKNDNNAWKGLGIDGKQWWAEPDLYGAGWKMRDLVENKKVLKRGYKTARFGPCSPRDYNWMKENFSYKVIADKFMEMIA